MVKSLSAAGPATGVSDFAIRTRGLQKRYRNGTEALRGLDFEVRSGELFGVIGPDGAGKTTVLNILSGVMEPTAGDATVFGKRPNAVRNHIGYVTQSFSMFPDLSVEENLRYSAGLRGITEAEFRERKDKLMRLIGLYQFSDRLAQDLSGGMKQKLMLCATLIARPRLLLLDEPTNGVDPVSRREVWQILSEIRRHATIVIATPYLDEAERCDRIAMLYEGQVHETGAPAELRESLGLRRIEVRNTSVDGAEATMKSVSQQCRSDIIDIYTIGEKLNILVEDNYETTQKLRSVLTLHEPADDDVHVMSPNLDNVFVMKLRELGLKLTEPPPLPRIHEKPEDDRFGRDPEIAIHAEGLSKWFDHFEAVKNIDLDIHYGDIFGLLGANGSGKTTTIRMLCGLLQPTSGQVALSGESGNLRSPRVRKLIGYMSQRFTLYEGLTVKENLEFYSSIYEIPRRYRKEKVNWAIEACGLTGMEKVLVGSLPRGWKQRIAFGASVMHEPEILFLDEPTAGVDPVARRQLWTLIRDVARGGTAVLITTHHLDEAEFCSSLCLMSEGSVIARGSPREIRDSHPGSSLEDAFISIVNRRRSDFHESYSDTSE